MSLLSCEIVGIESDNQDANEVEKFTRLAQDWWDSTGDVKTLHSINPVRTKYITARFPVRDRCVLDVGCGGGLLTEALAKAGANMTGIDASQAAIRTARQHASEHHLRIDYHCLTAEALLQTSEQRFDAITCMELLEHVPDPEQLLHTLARLLNPGGHIVLSTINRNLPSYLGAVVAAEYLLHLLPKGTHDYSRFIRPSELYRWLRAANFHAEDIVGLHYLPGVNYCTLTSAPTINYMVHARLGA